MSGKKLVGLADVQGHKWAKIVFEGDLELPTQEVVQKIIGVKWKETPALDVQVAKEYLYLM